MNFPSPTTSRSGPPNNYYHKVVDAFGEEWTRFDQSTLSEAELNDMFHGYFDIFPWDRIDRNAEGFDMGCGSGRWSKLVAPRVGKLHCIDASARAIDVAKANLAAFSNCRFHHASIDATPLGDASQDFGYCLGVLHHLPDPASGLASCARKLKPGAPFLVYLYYAFDIRPVWFRALWRMSDFLRRVTSQLPYAWRYFVSQIIAIYFYWPLARLSKIAEKGGLAITHFPLSYHRNHSFYTMRTDAFDRFGTRVEKRFTRTQVNQMMYDAGFVNLRFSEHAPYWCAVGFRKQSD